MTINLWIDELFTGFLEDIAQNITIVMAILVIEISYHLLAISPKKDVHGLVVLS